MRKKPVALSVEVVINHHKITAYADTGAEINIMSYDTAKRLKLPLQKTRMRIRPYGSRSKACKGCYTGTIMYGCAVTNATVYIIDKPVETLLSGSTCEQLGIIEFHEAAHVGRTETQTDPQKEALRKKFPSIFEGVGTLKDYKVTLHINEDVKPVCQPARPIPFHLRKKCEKELETMEREGIIEEHTGPCPWLSNLSFHQRMMDAHMSP